MDLHSSQLSISKSIKGNTKFFCLEPHWMNDMVFLFLLLYHWQKIFFLSVTACEANLIRCKKPLVVNVYLLMTLSLRYDVLISCTIRCVIMCFILVLSKVNPLQIQLTWNVWIYFSLSFFMILNPRMCTITSILYAQTGPTVWCCGDSL